MLFGEHAVLQKKLAIAAAVNQRITCMIHRRDDNKIRIASSLGFHECTIQNITPSPNFSFVIAALKNYKDTITEGFDLTIESDFSHTIGFGSSAAVTVACHAALSSFLQQPFNLNVLFEKATQTVRHVQGIASGTDVAASVFGGIVAYRIDPLMIEPLNCCHPLVAIFSGSKMATRDVIKKVQDAQNKSPEVFHQIFEAMESVSMQAKKAMIQGNWKEVGRLCTIYQGLMDAIGVNNTALSDIIWSLRQDPQILGAKISGSGLGDCCIGFGSTSSSFSHPYQAIPCEMSLKGVSFD